MAKKEQKNISNEIFSSQEWIGEILDITDTGLWTIHINQNTGVNQLFASKTMLRLLGLSKSISPEECYEYWYGRINKGYYACVQHAIEQMLKVKQLVEVQYTWNHPELGDITVRCCGRNEELEDGVYQLRGYHQNISELEQTKIALTKIKNEVFECNLLSHTMNIHTNHILIYGHEKRVYKFPEEWIRNGIVHPNSARDFSGAFERVKNGKKRASCELQLKNTEGKYSWFRMELEVNPEGKTEAVTGVLEDITKQKEIELAYVQETKFYQALLSETTAYAEVNVTQDRLKRTGGVWDFYNEVLEEKSYSQIIHESVKKFIHPEDRKKYLEIIENSVLLDSYKRGNVRLRCELRRIIEENKMRWMEITVHLFKEVYTEDILAVLYMKDIDDKKKKELALCHESRRDSLTGVYNKRTIRACIEEGLKRVEKGERFAFIILDLDNFKQINDQYGHKKGDQVLIGLNYILRRVFCGGDLIGRFGGDEFIILVQNIYSQEDIQKKIQNFYNSLAEENNPELSCSIGIALAPEHGKTYERLFQCADRALYSAKKSKRGSFAYYQEDGAAGEIGQIIELDNYFWDREETSVDSVYLKEETTAFAAFLSEVGDMAYIINPYTYELLEGNKAFFDRLGRIRSQCIGMRCYEILQNRKTPCPFCSKVNWNAERFYLWKNYNPVLQDEFLIKNKLIQWNGQEVLLAITVDIQNGKNELNILDDQSNIESLALSSIYGMSQAKDLTEAMSSALETIGHYYRSSHAMLLEKKSHSFAYQSTYEWHKNEKMYEDDFLFLERLEGWAAKIDCCRPIYFNSPEEVLLNSFIMYTCMKENGIFNIIVIPMSENRKKFGYIIVFNSSGNLENLVFGESFSYFIMQELKKRRMVEDLRYVSYYDALTGLLNRNSYVKYCQTFESDKLSSVGVICLNVNGLKLVNNMEGNGKGDQILKQLAHILKEIFSKTYVFRISGDEFMVIMKNIPQIEFEEMFQKLKDVIKKETFDVAVGKVWDQEEKELELCISQATELMKVDKQRWHDCKNMSAVRRGNMLNKLMISIERDKFEVFLQPKTELGKQGFIGAEALIRYRNGETGLIPPGKFIGILENNHLIQYVDLFVFEEVCKLLEKWKNQGKKLPVISLNFSRLTLLETDILKKVKAIKKKYDVDTRYIEIEITESIAKLGKDIICNVIKTLKKEGYPISLDDFGSKYSNLSILADMQFDVLKLDKSLVSNLTDNPMNKIIVKNVISMCHDMRIQTIAEGIETLQQETLLQELGCDLGQGYLHGRPMEVQKFEKKWIESEQCGKN